MTSRLEALLSTIHSVASTFSHPVYLVGGSVRDFLCEIPTRTVDVDLVTESDSASIAYAVASKLPVSIQTFPQFLTAKIVYDGESVDIATSRKEVYEKPGALPTVSPTEIRSDAYRRDFSVNALYVPLDDIIGHIGTFFKAFRASSTFNLTPLDFVGGVKDISSRTVRILHEKSFIDDPTRLFRAARYAVKIRGSVSSETQKCIEDAIEKGVLNTISLHRKINEIRKSIEQRESVEVFSLLQSWGCLKDLTFLSMENEGAHFYTLLSHLYRCDASYTLSKESIFDCALHLKVILSGSLDETSLRALGLPKKRMKNIVGQKMGKEAKDLSMERIIARIIVERGTKMTSSELQEIISSNSHLSR